MMCFMAGMLGWVYREDGYSRGYVLGERFGVCCRDLGQTFHVKSQMRQSACFIGNIPKTQFYWGMF